MRFWPGKKETNEIVPAPLRQTASAATPGKIRRPKTKKAGKLKVTPHVRKRFESYLDKRRSKCWTWKGSRTSDGYGQFWLNDLKVVKAHRFAYEILVRQLSPKDRLKNICKGKSCLNPACWEVHTVGTAAKKRRRG